MVGAASHKRDDRERDDRAILIVRSVEILPPVSALLAITPKIFPFLMAKSVPPNNVRLRRATGPQAGVRYASDAEQPCIEFQAGFHRTAQRQAGERHTYRCCQAGALRHQKAAVH